MAMAALPQWQGDRPCAQHHQSRHSGTSIGAEPDRQPGARAGGGRKSAVAHQPDLPAALEALIEDAIRGDPGSPLRWVSRSLRHLVKALSAKGFQASQRVVANLLREQNYSCQANRKTREGGNHPDRDAEFAHINTTVKAVIAAGEPAISVDTEKKELVGDFKNLAASCASGAIRSRSGCMTSRYRSRQGRALWGL